MLLKMTIGRSGTSVKASQRFCLVPRKERRGTSSKATTALRTGRQRSYGVYTDEAVATDNHS